MSKITIALLLIISVALAAQKTHKDLVEQVRAALIKDLSSDKVESLERVLSKVQAIKDTGVPNHLVYPEKEVCAYLTKLKVTPESPASTIEQFIVLRNTFNCDKIEVKKTFEDYLKKVARSDRYQDARAAINLWNKEGLVDEERVKELCNKFPEYLGADGLIKSTKKGEASSIKETAQFLLALDTCVYRNHANAKAKESITKNLEALLQSAKYIGEDQLAFVEDDYLVSTARVLHRILQVSPGSVSASRLSHFVNYLAANIDALFSEERLIAVLGVSKYVAKVPIVKLSSSAISINKKSTISAKVDTLLGEKLENLTGKASLVHKSNNVVENINLKYENGVLSGEFDGSKLKAGYYTANIELSQDSSIYTTKASLLVQGTVSIASLRYDVTKSSSAPESPLDYDAKYPNKNSEVLKANQNNYIHVQFKVNSDSPYVTALIRLKHKTYRFATGTIIAKQTKDSNVFNAVIDLGDPDHILPYNGVYDLEVVVGSEYVSQVITWTFASFNINFIRPAEKAPGSESDVQLLPEIKHMFPGDRKKANPVITLAFAGAAALIFGIFIIAVGKLGLNFNKFPTSFTGSIFSFAFLATIIALVGILVLFWTKINLFETLTYLLLAVVPTLFIGKKAFSEIKIDN